MRPRFRRRTAVAPEEAFRRIREAVADPACPFRARFAENHGHAELRVQERLRHFWSPTLSLEIRPDDDATTLHGLFGPHPAVWTFFMFVHFAAVTGALLGLALAWSQWSLDESAWGLWSLPAAGIASGAAYAASLFGQRLARDEMASMLALVDRVAPEAVVPAASPDVR
jgi:hypothetical protein